MRPAPVRLRALAALVAFAVVVVVVPAGAQGSGELAAAKQRVAQIARELEAARGSASQAEQALADADARLREIEAVVNEIAVQIEQQQDRVRSAADELQRLEDEAARVQATFDARVAEMFKRSATRDLDVLLSSTDLQAAIDRTSMLRVIGDADRATLQRVAATQIQIDVQRKAFTHEVERLEQMRAEQEEILAQVKQLRESRALAVANARAEVVELSREKENLEADQKRIEELIRVRQNPVPMNVAAGGYGWPLCGNVTSEFGRRWGRAHEGMDIDDNFTNAIVAAKAGTVIFTGWSGGYGQLTLIDHHDGVVTAYAHQAAMMVSEGQSVTRGQRIGTVGTTGSSTGTHLHFETRVNGSAVNPRRYLPGGC